LLKTEDDFLEVRAAIGLKPEIGWRHANESRLAGRIAASRGPVIITDLDPEDIARPTLRERGPCSILGAPLVVEGHVAGVLHVGTLQPRVH